MGTYLIRPPARLAWAHVQRIAAHSRWAACISRLFCVSGALRGDGTGRLTYPARRRETVERVQEAANAMGWTLTADERTMIEAF
jgi:hypothetical protein